MDIVSVNVYRTALAQIRLGVFASKCSQSQSQALRCTVRVIEANHALYPFYRNKREDEGCIVFDVFERLVFEVIRNVYKL